MRRITTLLTLTMCLSVGVQAADVKSGMGFLKLGAGARELAMGSASTALSSNVNSISWNPAGLAHLRTSQLGFTHAQWFQGSSYNFVGMAMPSHIGTVGLSGTYVSYGQQDGRNDAGEKTGAVSASDLAMALSYARQVSRFDVGANIKMIQSRIGQDSANGFAVDAGTQYHVRQTSLGLSVRNLGPAVGFIDQKDPLPLTLSLGVGQQIFKGLFINTELQRDVNDKRNNLVIGSEYWAVSNVALRMGYLPLSQSHGKLDTSDSTHNFSNFSGGLGLKLGSMEIDYAFTPSSSLGDAHRFSLATSF